MTTYTSTWVSRDGSSNGTKPKGARLALGGLVAPNGASILDVRLGVLADNGAAVVAGTSSMTYDVRAGVFVSNPTGAVANGPVIGANDATVNVATTAAPGSNSRYDVIWVRQHVVVADGGVDTDVILEIGVTQGTVAASPSVPSIPTGALSLYNVLVTAAATATNTLTFTRTHNWTVARGGVVPIYTSTERSAITAYKGMTIWYDVDKTILVWDGNAWSAPTYRPRCELIATATTALTQNVYTTIAFATTSNDDAAYYTVSAGVITVLKAGRYDISGFARIDGGTAGIRGVSIQKNGIAVNVAAALAAGQANFQSTPVVLGLTLAANDTIRLSGFSDATGSATLDDANNHSRLSITKVG